MARIPRFLTGAALVVALAVAAGPAPPVGASCIGPLITLRLPAAAVDRGDAIEVVGEGWGDACHDTGVPPDAEGVLGHPRTGIDLVFVQGGRRILAAHGDADRDYGFRVRVHIPAGLAPGSATIVARLDGRDVQPMRAGEVQRFTVSAAPASAASPDEPATFGGTQTTVGDPTRSDGDARPEPSSDAGADRPWAVIALGAIGMVGLTAAAVRFLARRRATS